MSGDKGTKEQDNQELLDKLDVAGHGGWYLWKLFLLCLIPSILNGLNVTSYVYLAEVPTYWCKVPELSVTNWTETQKWMISNPKNTSESSCKMKNWDYSYLATLTFDEALDYTKSQNSPGEVSCSEYSYNKTSESMVVDYDLVCERTALKSTIQVALSLGKFLGAFFFGIISDKYGRRPSFLFGSLLYIICGPLVGFAADYSMIIIGRIGLGAAGSAIYQSAYVILTEIANKKRRATLGILYNMSYPIGQMVVPLIAFYLRDWRVLQLAISAPAILTILFYWLLPESPRWLLSKGRKEEATKIIENAYQYRLNKQKGFVKSVGADGVTMTIMTDTPAAEERNVEESGRVREAEPQAVGQEATSVFDKLCKKLLESLSQLFDLLRHGELRRRLLTMLFCWCVCSLSYYALALNVDNFGVDRYLYGFLTGLVEAPSYILPLPFLKCLGRRHAAIFLFYIGGAALLILLAIPPTTDLNIPLLMIASLGRLCVSGVFAVVILHTSELFPTVLRNSAIGCGSTASHIGSMAAPFLVDLLGAYNESIPSTVCGVTTIVAGTLIFLLPETKNKPLPETVEDVIRAPKDSRTGCHQVCSCR